MRNVKIVFIISAIALSLALSAYADTVQLKNGGSVSGIIGKEDGEKVEIDMGFGTMTFKKSQIKDIERSSPEDLKALSEKWETKREELKSKEKEFEAARNKRLESAYEYRMEDERIKKSAMEHDTKHINIVRDPDTNSVMVPALLNNKVKVNLIIDTGASVVVLSRKIGSELGVDLSDTKKDVMEVCLADGKKTTAKALILNSVKIQDVEVNNVQAVIILDQVRSPGVSEGLLGMSFLNRFNLKTDFKGMKMSLEKIE